MEERTRVPHGLKEQFRAFRKDADWFVKFLTILATLLLVLLLAGGIFFVSNLVAGANESRVEQERIAVANDLNAKGDLGRVATAQAAFLAERDSYAGVGVGTYTQETALAALSSSSIGFTPTAGNPIRLFASSAGWVAMTRSVTGTRYVITSRSDAITESVPDALPEGVQATDVMVAFQAL